MAASGMLAEGSSPSQAFLEELSKEVGHPVIPTDTWGDALGGMIADDAAAEAHEVAPAPTVAMLHSPAHHASQVGYAPGVIVAAKKSSSTEIWKILKLTDDQTVLTLLVDGDGTTEQTLPTAELLEQWRVHKGKITSPLYLWNAADLTGSPAQSPAWAADGVKGAVALALRAAYVDHESVVQGLQVLQHPNGVKATTKFPKGKLILVAASQRVERCKSTTTVGSNAFSVGVFDVAGTHAMFQVCHHFVPPVVGRDSKQQAAWVAPFWLVESGEDSAVNMEVVYEEHLSRKGSIKPQGFRGLATSRCAVLLVLVPGFPFGVSSRFADLCACRFCLFLVSWCLFCFTYS